MLLCVNILLFSFQEIRRTNHGYMMQPDCDDFAVVVFTKVNPVVINDQQQGLYIVQVTDSSKVLTLRLPNQSKTQCKVCPSDH